MARRKVGSFALVAGATVGVFGAALSAARKPPEPAVEPSTERVSRRMLVNREDMASVYAAKPITYVITKRVLDIAFSGVALIVLSPVFAVTAAAIVAEDGLPIFYKSERPGRGMHSFDMLKFRSMKNGADKQLGNLMDSNEQTGAAFKIKEDPRVTRVGKVIRKYSIDELPQLVNIIKGDMSIVGPRAIVPAEEFGAHERQRQLVRPGLTCYWQTMGRTAIPWEEWVELDLDYIQDMSLATDAKLILATVPVVLSGGGE